MILPPIILPWRGGAVLSGLTGRTLSFDQPLNQVGARGTGRLTSARMRRLSVLLTGLAVTMRCCLWAAPGHPVELVPASVLAWDSDFKKIQAGPDVKEVWFDFWVTNVCQTNVLVVNVDTSCGCAVAQLPSLPWVLTPASQAPCGSTWTFEAAPAQSSRAWK